MHAFDIQVIIFISLCLYAFCVKETPLVLFNVSAKTKSGSKKILEDATGAIGEGKLHAIIGSSGSGKTTLLNVLAGATPKGSLDLRGELLSSYTAAPIFVQQEDLLFAQMTVEETLSTSATLKALNTETNFPSNKRSIVDEFISVLGLKKVRKTKVGDAKTRGVSGGEKKRLCIGNEIIDDTVGERLIFCDEPTSGLDSFQAQRVMQLLKDLTKKGNTVVASIHQPRNSIYAMFDEITLMSEGRVIYSGPATEMTTYFATQGYPCPSQINPAEYYVDLVSIDYSSPEDEKESRDRIMRLGDSFQSQWRFSDLAKPSHNLSYVASKKKRGSFGLRSIVRKFVSSVKTFGVLFVRSWKQVTRDKALNVARLCSNVFSALLFGAIYFKLGNSAVTVPDRLGLLQVAAVNTAMTALIKATTSFVTEKLIVQRERRYETYPVGSYFLAKLAAEVPLSAFFPCLAGLLMYKLCGLNPAPGRLQQFLAILTVESMASTSFGMAVGSLASSVESAIATAPALMVIFIVFGGLYVVNTPWYLQWVPKISLIRWAYEALCINEFTGLKLVPKSDSGSLSVKSGEQVLESLGYGADASVGRALRAQAAIILGNYLFTYLSLSLQKPSFERLGGVGTPSTPGKDGGRTRGSDVVNSTNSDDERKDGEDDDDDISTPSRKSPSSKKTSLPLVTIPVRGM